MHISVLFHQVFTIGPVVAARGFSRDSQLITRLKTWR